MGEGTPPLGSLAATLLLVHTLARPRRRGHHIPCRPWRRRPLPAHRHHHRPGGGWLPLHPARARGCHGGQTSRATAAPMMAQEGHWPTSFSSSSSGRLR
ncbi:hypothetical protein BRADI_1g52562v3 [Brachypodium distachyon]|uniref:Uncharacterized protein n=1 Tax=Brachypodium distachyon TaxID=15368 RepID=A0A2K2DR37_BRADI|nr:hypothetical protein BRADI_1g52562v3 [Brachypodium distachyon]